MPKIIIKEYDMTKTPSAEAVNFSVVVPGFVKNTIASTKPTTTSGLYKETSGDGCVYYHNKDDGAVYTGDILVFDINEIFECSDKALFETVIGDVEPGATNSNHYGNLIARHLLDLGYTVLYKKLDTTTKWGTAESTGINALKEDDYWKALTDRSVYDFRYLMAGLITGGSTANTLINDINKAMVNVAEFSNSSTTSTGRGDCIALCDIDKTNYAGTLTQATVISNITTAMSTTGVKSKYAAFFAPYVVYSDGKEFPASFHYLTCAAAARNNNFPEWFAVAGYTRGISDYTVIKTGYPFGEQMVNALQPRTSGGITGSVNVITKLNKNYYIWGNRTSATLGTELQASHFLNIRQLCCTLKKQIYTTCKSLTFDPNSDLLWINFCNAIRPLLEKMKASQGISNYKFVKVATDKKATLKALIRIVPIEAVEDFDIGVTLEDDLSGTVVTED